MRLNINFNSNFFRHLCAYTLVTGSSALMCAMIGMYVGQRNAYQYANDHGCVDEFNYWQHFPTATAQQACGGLSSCCDTANTIWGDTIDQAAGFGALAGVGGILLFHGARYLKNRFCSNEETVAEQKPYRAMEV